MAEVREQLSLHLAPVDPFAVDYFVKHSGVAQAAEILAQTIDELVLRPDSFRMLFIYGPQGSGKTHLARSSGSIAQSRGISPQRIKLFDLDQAGCIEDIEDARQESAGTVLDKSWIAAFIANFESLKSSGGMLLVTSRLHPQNLSSNPHLLSRLLSGDVLTLSYPREEELRPLVLSLLERRNLRLSEKSIQYLLRRLPADPLSFDNIFVKINELSLSQNKPAGFGVVREVVREEEQPEPKPEH